MRDFFPPLLVLLLATAGLLVTGCASGPTEREELRAHMFSNFWRAGSIHSRLIVGDLDAARQPARWLAANLAAEEVEMGDPGYAERLRREVLALERAESLSEAAEATARVAGTCGACHQATAGGPRFTSVSPPTVGEDRVAHMLRHLWAVDRMWEGLIAPRSGHWELGAGLLAGEGALTSGRIPSGVAGGSDLASRVHELGERASTSGEPEERMSLFADLLETCASCHQQAGVPRG